jgi:two-component system sensor kinase FixL
MSTEQDSFNKLLSETIVWEILASVADAVITVDEDHRVVYCNKAAEQMFGHTCSEMLGRDVSPLIPPPHHELHKDYVNRYIHTGVARVIGRSRECSGQRRDGSTFPVEISYSVSRTEGRLYFTAVIRDISERKQMEREIRFNEKLADIGKAVAHVVHEIRKPLMLIGGFARQVEGCDALRNDEKDRRKLNIVLKEVKRLETLLSGISLLTRPPSSSRKVVVSVNLILNEILDLLQPMLQNRKIEVVTRMSEESMNILGDPDQLKQVFLNLLQNSIDAMKGVGQIRISSCPSEGKARIVIRDDGPGIPEDLRQKVFDPFFTTKPEGTGLGLAISFNIIKDHDGSLSIESSSSQGTAFVVELPLDNR